MEDEPSVDEGRKNSSMDIWKPALTVGLALVVVWVLLFISRVITIVTLSFYLKPLWKFWWEYDTGRYPVYSAIHYLLYGCLMFILACLLVMKKGWHVALFDELQPKINRQTMNYFGIGLIVGALAIIALNTITTLFDTYLFSGFLYVGFISERLAVAALYIVPLLVQSIGLVVLTQGYFQRTISKNYGWLAGLIVAAFIFMILMNLPVLTGFFYNPLYFAGDLITGFIIAYLFMRTKSIYMPIGYVFAWYLFSFVYDGFTSVAWMGSVATFNGFSIDLVTYILRMLIPFIVLELIWYFGDKSSEELVELQGKLANAVSFFRPHDDED